MPGLFVLALFVVLVARREPPQTSPKLAALQGSTMGTSWTLRWIPEPGEDPSEHIRVTVQGALDEVEQSMSTYRPSSDLMKLNAAPALKPVGVTSMLMEVLREADRVHRWTEGAFDISVGPLVRAWGFGHQPASEPPAEHELRELRARVGQQHVVLGDETSPGGEEVTRRVEGMFLDLSALAKGYGVDRAVEALRATGVQSAMLEVGGEIRVLGGRGDRPWSLGIETPDGGEQDVGLIVPLKDGALATSGDYRQVILHEGKLRSHTIDPRTGRPVDHGLASVSVVADTCMRADALATGLLVLGDDVGHRVAEERGWAALFISRNTDGSFRERTTAAWDKRLAVESPPNAH